MQTLNKRVRLGVAQFGSAALLLLLTHFSVKSFVESAAFSPGFFIYSPGGESLAYEEFKKARGRKIAFVGNSVMAALDFPRLRCVMKRHYGQDYEAFNFGRPAQGVGDYRVILAKLRDLKPDLIVLQIHEVSIAGKVFRTNVRGQIVDRTVLRRLGPKVFLEAYGMEGFFQSPLFQLPIYPYRDPLRQVQLQRSVYFGSTLKDMRSKFWRHAFQGLDPFRETTEDAKVKLGEDAEPSVKNIGGYETELDAVQVRIFEEMLEDLKTTGIPYFVYLQPVPPSKQQASTGDFFRKTLRRHGIEFTDIRNDYPENLFTTMFVHMRDSRHMFDLMFGTSTEPVATFAATSAREAGYCAGVRSRFDTRRVDEFGMFKQLSIEGELKRRDYFLFHGQQLMRIRPGSPNKIGNDVLADFAAGFPVAIEDPAHFWAPSNVMDDLRVVHIRKCENAKGDSHLQSLRFIAVPIPHQRVADLFQIVVNGIPVAELGSVEAEMNAGYWQLDKSTSQVTLILPAGEPIKEVKVSYINNERALGTRLKAL